MTDKFSIGDRVIEKSTSHFGTVVSTSNPYNNQYPYSVLFDNFNGAVWMREDELDFISGVAIQRHVFSSNQTGKTAHINCGIVTLPPGMSLALPGTASTNIKFDGWWIGDDSSSASEDTKKKRREAGQCEECGDLLPMSVWGLGECPKHPKAPVGKQ